MFNSSRRGCVLLRRCEAVPRIQLENLLHQARQIGQNEIMMHVPHPRRADQHGCRTDSSRCLRILPFVADNKRPVKIKSPLVSRLEQQPWFWFAAETTVAVLMRANEQI